MRRLTANIFLSCIILTSAAGAAETALREESLQRYTGDFWEETEAFAAEVRVIDGRLWAVHSPTRRNELVPSGPDRFEMVGLPAKVFVEYTMDASGVVEMRRTIDGQPRGRFTPFTPRQVTAEELADYTGDYSSPDGDVHYLLTSEGGKLWFAAGGEKKQELTALFDEIFEHPEVGSFIFSRTPDGLVNGFLLRTRQAPGQVFKKQQP